MLKMSSKTKNSGTTESFVPVKAIINNMIELDIGEKVAGVKVAPKNIFIMEENDQFLVIDRLKDFYNTLDFEFWLVIADRHVDISVYIAQLQMAYNNAKDPIIRKLINEDLKKANDFTDEVSDVEFYFFFKERNMEIIELHKQGIIDVMGTCKRSLIEFYKNEGYKTAFITNRVVLPEKVKRTRKTKEIKIGLYAAKSDDWRKNMFTQIAAVALIDNAVLDMVPLNPDAIEFAKILGVKLEGLEKPIPRQELIKRLADNDLNLYVTFSECAPMLPLESFEVGVPCLTGNNHHYFKNTELEKYLVVNNEASAIDIAEKAKYCIENKKEIMDLCKKLVKENNKNSKNDVEKFINM